MIKALKILLGVILILAFVLGLTLFFINEPLPEGVKGQKAEELADKMLAELNKPAWDSLEYISWSYPRGHDFVWFKSKNTVEVYWDKYKVVLNTQTEQGVVYKNDQLIKKDVEEIVATALKYFYNDSFWLIAPYKIKDPGTIRSIVEYEGSDALLVQYTSGGVTPGDSYLWILDESYRPIAWKFWTSLVPIGGMEFTWEQWKDIQGAEISTFHDGIIDISITNLTFQEI